MEKVLVHYFEIGLKGKNRSFFENKLIENIKKSAKYQNANLTGINKENKRIICEFDDNREKIKETLKNVLGISSFSFVTEIDDNMKEMEKKVNEIIIDIKDRGFSKVAFNTRRANKKFNLKSPEINERYGEIANKLGMKVDYKNAENKIFSEILTDKVYIYEEKINGFRGLPVSTSGRVLVLLSGGIDSCVAAFEIMKRGCKADFLHIHTFRDNKEAYESKIKKIIELLNKYQFNARLYLISYSNYETFSGKIPERYDLVFFKHFLFKIAERVVLENNYDAIVTGDNLGQVASQTIENIKASQLSINVPLFMPLLTLDKQDIIKKAMEIGTYELSLEKYKDCCSLFAKNPLTKTKLNNFEKVVSGIDMESLIENSRLEIGIFDVS